MKIDPACLTLLLASSAAASFTLRTPYREKSSMWGGIESARDYKSDIYWVPSTSLKETIYLPSKYEKVNYLSEAEVESDGFNGKMATATVNWYSSRSTTSDYSMEVLAIQEYYNLMKMPYKINGFISLTRDSSYMQKLIDDGKIEKDVFWTKALKEFKFGEYDLSQNKNGADFVWFTQDHDLEGMWGTSQPVTGVAYGDTTSYNYDGYEQPAFFDTGFSFILAPRKLGADLINHYTNGLSVNWDEPIPLLKCSQTDSLPDLHFTLAGKKFTVPRADLVKRLASSVYGYDCYLSIMTSKQSHWVFGTPILDNYNAVFDNSEDVAKMGLQSYTLSKVPEIEEVEKYPTNVVDAQEKIGRSGTKLSKEVVHTSTKGGIYGQLVFSRVSGFIALPEDEVEEEEEEEEKVVATPVQSTDDSTDDSGFSPFSSVKMAAALSAALTLSAL